MKPQNTLIQPIARYNTFLILMVLFNYSPHRWTPSPQNGRGIERECRGRDAEHGDIHFKHRVTANEHGRRDGAVVDGDRDAGVERGIAVACVIVRKLLKDTGCETRGRDGAADGMGIEDGT